MENFDITSIIEGLPAAIVILLYLIFTKWADLKAAGSRLWSTKVQDSQDRREHQQEKELLAWEVEAQSLATREARAYQAENIAIEIAREYNHWARQEFGEMQKEIGKLTRVVDGLADSVRTLAGAVDQLDRDLNKRHDGQ